MDQEQLLSSFYNTGPSHSKGLYGTINESMEHDNYPSVIYEEDPIDMIEYHQTDHVMPNLIFKPKITSSSTWEDEEHDGYSSLPIEVDQANHVDSLYLGKLGNVQLRSHPWEAEDVNDFITTLDESQVLDIQSMESIAVPQPPRRTKNRPKSLYEPSTQAFTFTVSPTSYPLSDSGSQLSNQIMVTSGGPVQKCPKIMTTSCYGALNSDTNRIGSDSNLVLKTHEEMNQPFLNSQHLLENSLLWMASTEELIKMNHNISSIIQQKTSLKNGSRDDVLISLENSYCESSTSSSVNNLRCPSTSTMAMADVAESGK